jgi:hypothetical protein
MIRKLPRNPPPPLQGAHLERHFRGIWQVLWGKAQAAGGYSSIKVIVTLGLENQSQNRRLVAQWAQEGNLEPEALPDLILILDNSAVIRGNALRCLIDSGVSASDETTLYKLGDYHDQKWLGLMLLIFELTQRTDEGDGRQYIKSIVSQAPCSVLPD